MEQEEEHSLRKDTDKKAGVYIFLKKISIYPSFENSFFPKVLNLND